MRVPNLDIEELAQAYSIGGHEMEHYLNLKTGEVVVIMEHSGDPEDERLLELIEEDEDEETYLPVPQIDSDEGFHLMQLFVATVKDEQAKEALEEALQRRKPFRQFKDTLFDFPDERARWFKFEEEAHRQAMLDWLRRNDIEV